MADYATIKQLSARVYQYEASEDAVLAGLITNASRAVDRHCKVADDFFATASATPATKVVTGTGRGHIVLPPHVSGSLTTVVDEYAVTLTSSQYRATGNWLYALSSGYATTWLSGARLTVTARWGWAAVPADITEACLQICKRWYRGRDEAGAAVVDIQQAVVIDNAMPRGARDILNNWRSELIRKGWVNP